MKKITKTQAIHALNRGITVTVYRDRVNPKNDLGVGVAVVHQDDLRFPNSHQISFDEASDENLSPSKVLRARFNRFLRYFDYYNSLSELGNKTCYAIDD